jgi:2-polyprenyl-3-methyl-5-hydroxy-6-metoxy-1,4-benzoquinol methylase
MLEDSNKEKFNIQDMEYSIPYHHLVNFRHFSNAWIMPWGQEYYVYVKKVLDLSKKHNPKSIIDIGCGDGKISFELAKIYGEKIRNVGIDLSERAILLAKGLNYGNGAEFFYRSISDFKEQFDMVLLVEVLEHIPDNLTASFVSDVKDRLTKEGIIIISVPSDRIPLNKKHYRHYNEKLLTSQMVGFELQETHYLIKIGFVSNLLNKLIRKFSSMRIVRNFFFGLYIKFCAVGDEKSHQHIVSVYKKI